MPDAKDFSGVHNYKNDIFGLQGYCKECFYRRYNENREKELENVKLCTKSMRFSVDN